MNILFLSRWFPFPIDNGSKLRIHYLLTNLSKYNDITLLSFTDHSSFPVNVYEQYPHYPRFEVIPWKPYNSRSSQAFYGYFNSSPRFILDTYSSEMENLIRKYLKRERFDLIIASQLSMASYYSTFNGTPAIFEELELGLFYDPAMSANNLIRRVRHRLTWIKLRRYLSNLLSVFQSCTVVSERERKLFIQNFPEYEKKVVVIPNCISMQDYENLSVETSSNQIIFTGPFRYQVNYEAILWFVQHVFPTILKHLPDTQLVITGDHANLPLPSDQNITLTGFVDDIKPLIGASLVSIVPLLNGGGTRLKILEAMAIGTPVVATSKGAEGLDIVNGKHLLIANSPDTFAEQVIRLIRNRELRDRLTDNAKSLVKEKYDWAAVTPTLQQFIEHMSGTKNRL